MISNKQRDVYKQIKTQSLLSVERNTEEYKICEELRVLGYLKLKSNTNTHTSYNITENKMPRKPREKAYKKLKLIKENITIPVKRCEKPKFGGKGRTWDYIEHNVDNTTTKCHYDTSWGNYMYLSASDDRWYKIDINPEIAYYDDNQDYIKKGIEIITSSEMVECQFQY